MGNALPTWAYANEELLELEYPYFFVRTWQFAGHESELRKPGDFITLDLWRDSVVILHGRDGELRAFLNICRHRASRLLDGRGNCGATIRCRYHGWSYWNDGGLSGIPSPENFPGVDRSQLGLLEIQCEVYRGLVFVRIDGDGPSVASQLGQVDGWIKSYRPEDYVLLSEPVTETWKANWKIAWDNYLENYHIPVGHPGLHRLVVESDEGAILPGGSSAGFFEMNPKPSRVEHERRYQEQVGCTDHRYPAAIRRKWLQLDFESNMGVEFYPALFVVFQVLPLAADESLIRMSLYSPPDLNTDEEEIRSIELKLLDEVNAEDKVLCERIQRGVGTHGYQPGPLSLEESGIHDFHERVRTYLPVTGLAEAPPRGELEAYNRQLTGPTGG
ncbi:MAG: aromatic ring-hydroxylating dioxygenase subunit alpha [Myxococcota bacterium]